MKKVLIIDFGSQFTQLIARRVRELRIYSEIHPYNNLPPFDDSIAAVILSGSPFSVVHSPEVEVDLDFILNNYPVLGICFGAQLVASKLGGRVEASDKREYGKAQLNLVGSPDSFYRGVDNHAQVWMSHSDSIVALPDNYEVIAQTNDIPVAAFKSKNGSTPYPVYCLQYHVEVSHTLEGSKMLKNFLVDVVGIEQTWDASHFIDSTVQEIRDQVGDDKVILGLSGGVDSTVAAQLLHLSIGKQLTCIFIDNGLLRKNEFEQVLADYQHMGLNILGIEAADDFLNELDGVSDPEEKRKTIGRVFIEIFEREAKKIKGAKWLGQGTIYPDVIESISVHGPSATIKSHHNVGGLPEKLGLGIVEPLRTLFKDEVRKIGRELAISEKILERHPFPGPGLAIRVLGALSEEKIRLCREADAIYIKGLKDWKLYQKVWQAGAILLPVQSVGVMGDERTYEFTIALRAVNSRDGMTAEWSQLPYDFMAFISTEIINKVKGINRVVYDISTKPPATIEWE